MLLLHTRLARLGTRAVTKWGCFGVRSVNKALQCMLQQRPARKTCDSPEGAAWCVCPAWQLQKRWGHKFRWCRQFASSNVPQPKDWLKDWRAVKAQVSFNTAAKICSKTEAVILSNRKVPCSRCALCNLIIACVAEEVKRLRTHNKLREATCRSIQVDDGGITACLVVCRLPTRWWDSCTLSGSASQMGASSSCRCACLLGWARRVWVCLSKQQTIMNEWIDYY